MSFIAFVLLRGPSFLSLGCDHSSDSPSLEAKGKRHPMKLPHAPLVLLVSGMLPACLAFSQGRIVQIDLRELLNARVVTTMTSGSLATWSDALDGVTSGEATRAAALAIGEPFAQALPDDGVFEATSGHPRMKLAFSNADGRSPQVRRSLGEDTYTIKVPEGRFAQLWLALMSGYGESTVRFSLHYAEGPDQVFEVVVPDWYFPASATDRRWVNLASDMGKWSSSNHLMEKDHHYLHGFNLEPDSARTLLSVRVEKAKKAALTLWGATAVSADR